jgi:hypothetical protein
LRTSQAVTEKQRDYRQNCRRNGDNPHLTVDCTAERGGLTTPPFAGSGLITVPRHRIFAKCLHNLFAFC